MKRNKKVWLIMYMSFKMVRNLGMSVMLIIIVGIGLVFFDTTKGITRSISVIIMEDRPKLDLIDGIRQNFIDARNAFTDFTKGDEKDSAVTALFINNVIEKSRALADMVSTEEERRQVTDFTTAAKRLKAAVITYAEEFNYDPTGDSAVSMEKIVIDETKNASDTAAVMIKEINNRIETADKKMLSIIKRSRRLTIISISITIALAFLLAFLINYALAKPVKQLVAGTKKIAKGDLNFRVKVESHDELGQLAASFNKMAEDLDASLGKDKRMTEELRALNQQLEASKHKLEALNDSLEHKIQERTEELRKAKDLLQIKVEGRTKDLRDKMIELEKMNKLMMGREIQMIERKKEIDGLLRELGRPSRYGY